jgi:hypothetical protein
MKNDLFTVPQTIDIGTNLDQLKLGRQLLQHAIENLKNVPNWRALVPMELRENAMLLVGDLIEVTQAVAEREGLK